jgi:hypothetical protein
MGENEALRGQMEGAQGAAPGMKKGGKVKKFGMGGMPGTPVVDKTQPLPATPAPLPDRPAPGMGRGPMGRGPMGRNPMQNEARQIFQMNNRLQSMGAPGALGSLSDVRNHYKNYMQGQPAKTMKKGGSVKSSASKRADGIATKGKTRGKMV